MAKTKYKYSLENFHVLCLAIEGLLKHPSVYPCDHADLSRLGFIWTKCEDCGTMWADDDGGFKPTPIRPEVLAAEAALAKARGEA